MRFSATLTSTLLIAALGVVSAIAAEVPPDKAPVLRGMIVGGVVSRPDPLKEQLTGSLRTSDMLQVRVYSDDKQYLGVVADVVISYDHVDSYLILLKNGTPVALDPRKVHRNGRRFVTEQTAAEVRSLPHYRYTKSPF